MTEINAISILAFFVSDYQGFSYVSIFIFDLFFRVSEKSM